MITELVAVGTEILLGNIVNTNSAYLAEKCAQLGLSLYYQTVVGDNEQRMKDTIKTALDRSDVVILTGGLGPTEGRSDKGDHSGSYGASSCGRRSQQRASGRVSEAVRKK